MSITIDFETKSEADLVKVGAWAYSEHPSTDVICVCWGIDAKPIETWWPKNADGLGRPEAPIPMHGAMPRSLYRAMMDGHEVEAHNVSFERSIWTNVLAKRYGWTLPRPEQWRDTMAVACYYAMPAALDKLARALNFQPKDPEGTRLISKYSKLNLKSAKRQIPAADFEKFCAYCKQDVKIEQSVSDYLGDLPDRELPIFLLDQKINMRGLYLNQDSIDDAVSVIDQREAEYVQEFRKLTGLNPTQVAKVKDWFAEHGLELEDMRKDTLTDLLDDEAVLPQGPVRRAVELRLGTAAASTKKLDAMSRQRGNDGRARFQCRYHGAQTGRWTGTGFQPLNLKRGYEDLDPEQLVRDISYRNPKWLDTVYGNATTAVANASRHHIKAQEGNKIVAGDFSSIEAVVLAALAGEEWKLDAFRRGVKIYEMMGEKIHKLPPGTVTKKTHPSERQDGKTGELAFGYQGALNAWLKFDNSGRHSDERIIEICKSWRAEHPAIVRFWKELEYASLEAVLYPGRQTRYREIGFEVVDDWLSMILPNGKRIWYFNPQIREQMPHWHKQDVNEDCAAGTCNCRPKPTLTYMAMKNGQWRRVSTYGGKQAENATQTTSREILVTSMQALAEAWDAPLFQQGFLEEYESCIELSVYDEVVAEVPNDFRSKEEFVGILLNPKGKWWPDDWPIRMEAWEGEHYKK